MDLQKKLANLGIEQVRKLDNETIRMLAYNVTNAITKAFPIIYDEYNNILVKLLNCNMYLAKVTKPISKVNYIYENNSIYFDENINLNKLNEQIIHECVHYLQDFRNIKKKLNKIGLCNFEEFTLYGLGLNEAAVQYISAKCVGNIPLNIEKYGVYLRTISPDYYPFLTNLVEQIVYLIGEDVLVKGTLNGTQEFEDYLLNTFEANTKKIINRFDEMVEINNNLNLSKDLEKIQILKQGLANLYIETQSMIFTTYFEKICPRITSIKEIDEYAEKAIGYRDVMGVLKEERFAPDSFYDIKLSEITQKLDKKMYEISKNVSKNTVSVITMGSKIARLINKIFSYFTN